MSSTDSFCFDERNGLALHASFRTELKSGTDTGSSKSISGRLLGMRGCRPSWVVIPDGVGICLREGHLIQMKHERTALQLECSDELSEHIRQIVSGSKHCESSNHRMSVGVNLRPQARHATLYLHR